MLDRFRPPDARDEPRVVGYCAACDNEIYVGDYIYRTYDDDMVHEECLRDYAEQFIVEEKGRINSKREIE